MFSLLFWNVEEFDGAVAQLSQVSDHIRVPAPDVFGLAEVQNVDILDLIRNHLPEYDYSLTDGP
ncbi:MAG: hypothetical protein GTO63_02200 [Anaerolineae bacterium]|nr:hypothetical protein [Anaerolineae bacterium]NIN93867.1 hypothetical protein [Anaerolineae bacterium]NIQ76900.1 hypothetical protein [Anaerolineae bacterium]